MSVTKTSELKIVQHLSEDDDEYDWKRPTSDDYLNRFLLLNSHLNEEVHPNVNVGPSTREPMWLTDHGPEHIATVIRRIEDLIFRNGKCVLSPYETYLTIVAAHFHDIGNIFGREEHEKRAREIMFGLSDAYVGTNNIEKRMICEIAMSHGGKVGPYGDKDTIGNLQQERQVKKLAAILRFADELADDNTRTNRFVMDAIDESAPGSKIFHLYADRLNPPAVDHDTSSVKLTFELLKEHLAAQYPKLDGQAYLLDEIFLRTLKTFHEQVYCSKFMNPDVISERVEVEILICSDHYAKVVANINFTLEQTGYPDLGSKISQLAPSVGAMTGRAVAGIVDEIPNDKSNDYDEPVNLVSLLQSSAQTDAQ